MSIPLPVAPDMGEARASESGWLARVRNTIRLPRYSGTPKFDFRLLPKLWKIAAPYWFRDKLLWKWLAYALYVAYHFGSALLNAKAALYAGAQMQALASRNANVFYANMMYAFIAAMTTLFIALVVSAPFQLLRIYWERWLTQTVITAYLSSGSYFALFQNAAIDNPDERIANDISVCITALNGLFISVPFVFSNVGVFGYVLWSFGWYLLPALIVTVFARFFLDVAVNFMYLRLDYATRRVEGDFRNSVARMRSQSEQIAFLRGEEVEQFESNRHFSRVIGIARKTVYWDFYNNIAGATGGDLIDSVPEALSGNVVLKGSTNLKGYSVLLNAWGRTGAVLTSLVGEVRNFAQYGASIGRIYDLLEYAKTQSPASRLARSPIAIQKGGAFSISGLTVTLPDDRVLIRDLTVDTARQGNILIAGDNGVGKTALLRTIAGLWQNGRGTVSIPDRTLFMPQMPYLRFGSLRQQLIYPAAESDIGNESLRQILDSVSLGYLEEHGRGFENASVEWDSTLSPGERQRLMFARALVYRPDLLILDEATDALDPEGEEAMYELVRGIGCPLVSVSHHASLAAFHDSILTLERGGNWTLARLSRSDA